MARWNGFIRTTLVLLLSVGCTQSNEVYRTYSEAEDSAASPASDSSSNSGPDHASTVPAGTGVSPLEDAPTDKQAEAGLAASSAVEMPADLGSTSDSVTLPAANDLPTDSGQPPAMLADGPAQADQSGSVDATAPEVAATAQEPADKTASSTTVTEPLEIKLLIPEKEFARLDAGKTVRVSYDDLDLLKVLNMEPVPEDCVDYFPDWLKQLDGAQVRIRGFMVPPPRETGLPGFTLARDNEICCFGRDPKVYDVIPVFLKDGTTTKYIPNRPFDVVGRLFIRPDAYRGELQTLYEIEEAVIITQ